MIIGYTTGGYDLFHIEHLNLMKNAKGMCDKLIVGVTVDELVAYKGKKAIILILGFCSLSFSSVHLLTSFRIFIRLLGSDQLKLGSLIAVLCDKTYL